MAVTLRDTPVSYGATSIVLHWATALLVLLLLFTAALMAIWLPDRTAPVLNTPFGGLDRTTLVLIHEAFGLFLIPIATIRIGWRLYSRKPQPPRQARPLMFLAATAWRILLIGIAIQIVSGPLSLFFYGYPLQFFTTTVVPSPFPKSGSAQEIAETVHHFAGWTIMGVVVLHVGGALYHALFKRDGTLSRMILPGRTLRNPSPN